MRIYRSPWWSRLLWGCWQVAVIGFFLFIWGTDTSKDRPGIGIALMLGTGVAWVTTAIVIVGRDIIRDGYRTLRGEFKDLPPRPKVKLGYTTPPELAQLSFLIVFFAFVFFFVTLFNDHLANIQTLRETVLFSLMWFTVGGLAWSWDRFTKANDLADTERLREVVRRRSSQPVDRHTPTL